MGNCANQQQNLTPAQKEAAKKEQEINKKISKQMETDVKESERVIKILLLGAGESGKSTLFKQFVNLYGKGYTDEERKEYLPNIYENVLSQIKILSKQTERMEIKGCQITDAKSLASKEFIDDMKAEDTLTSDVAKHVAVLWADPAVKKTFDHRSLFQLNDSASYFFDRVNEIVSPTFVPSEADLLRIRVRTTGIVETSFEIDSNLFRLFDVGGQRNERKKWIHCFDNVTSVFFVAAINEYDQKLFEDKNTNRIDESLNLFEETLNSGHFDETPFVLFLNKRDIFAEKIAKVPITVAFPDYTGANTFEATTEYIIQQFVDKNRGASKDIYCHVTCATDKSNVKFVMDAVKDMIVNRNLQQSGLA